MSIRIRLVALLLAIAVIPVALTGLLTFRSYRSSLTSSRLAHLDDHGAFKAGEIEIYFAGLKTAIEMTRNSHLVRQNLPVLARLAARPADPEYRAAKTSLDDVLRKTPAALGLSEILLIDPSGAILYNICLGHRESDLHNPPPAILSSALAQEKGGIYFSAPYFHGQAGEELRMILAAPALDLDGAYAGTVVYETDLAQLNRILRDVTGLGDSGETLIGRKEGDQVVYLNPLRFDPQAALKRRVVIGEEIGLPIQKAVRGEKGHGLFPDYRGQKVLASWRYIPSLDWGLVAKIDAGEALAEVHNLRNLVMVIVALVIALGGIVSFAIARSIAGPIDRLARGAEIVGAGDLDHVVGIPRRDEIGRLSRTFDQMTRDLKRITASRDALNREVAERQRLELALKTLLQEQSVILDSVPALVFYKDAENRFVRTNKAFEDDMGLSKSELEGKSLFALYPKEQAEAYWRDDREVLASGRAKRSIIETLETARGTRLLQTDKIPYFDERGKLAGVIGFSIDITDRQRAEEALKKARDELETRVEQRTAELKKTAETLAVERRRFNDVLDKLPVYVVLLTPDYHVPFANRYFRERFGESFDRRCFEYLFQRSEPCEICETYKVLQAGERREWEWTGPDQRDYHIFDFPFADVDGSPLILEMGLDVTERKKSEAEVATYRQHLEELVQERTGQLEGVNRRLESEIAERKNIEESLRRAKEDWERTFNSVPDLIAILDDQHRILRTNKAMAERLGLKSEECAGLPCYKYVHGADRPPSFCPHSRTLKDGRQHIEEVCADRLGGYFLVSTTPLFDERGKMTGAVHVAHDITERVRTEETLRQTSDYLENLFNYANAPIICWDADLKITRFNHAFEHLSGYGAGEVIGKDLSVLFPAASREESLSKIKRTLSEHWEVVEVPIRRQNGGVRLALWNSANVYAKDGKTIIATIAQGQDITDRAAAETGLKKLNRTLRALSDSSQALTRAADESQYLKTVCRIIVEDCGYAMAWIGFAENDAEKTVRPVAHAGEEAGYLATAAISWADTPRGRGPTGVAIRSRRTVVCDDTNTDPDFRPWRQAAKERGYAASMSLPLITEGTVLGALSLYSRTPNPFSEDEVRLLTELADDVSYGIRGLRLRRDQARADAILKRDRDELEKLAEERARKLLAAQKELEKTKRLSDIGSLAATVAHELRNPLAAISFAASNIKRKAANPSLDVNLRTIRKKIAESDRIIDNLLFYSRLRPPDYENVSLHKLIHECIGGARPPGQKNPTFASGYASLRDVTIEADPLQVKEVLNNLLLNSRDAVPEKGGIIEVRGGADDETVTVAVVDNGPGIEQEVLDKVFDPFFTTKAKGTGLGLAICQSIVHMHGGEIQIESGPGRGTTVTVKLPRKRGERIHGR